MNNSNESFVSEGSTGGSWLNKLKQRLTKTRQQFSDAMGDLLLGKRELDQATREDLEALLLQADVGVDTTAYILDHLMQNLSRHQVGEASTLFEALQQQLVELLTPYEGTLDIRRAHPFVLLMVGVNGAGKTTTIAKLAHWFGQQDFRVMLAAGDTFRAAAVEQLMTWGERHGVPVIAQDSGADSASVVFDALQSAQARHYDLLIGDTAGRLHTQSNLMEELAKIKRVLKKLDPNAPHETMLVLDASMGQNALQQALAFHQAIGITSLAITKLDGTAKGGIIFAIAHQLKLPIHFIGIGEQAEDLRPFLAEPFVRALFERNVSR